MVGGARLMFRRFKPAGSAGRAEFDAYLKRFPEENLTPKNIGNNNLDKTRLHGESFPGFYVPYRAFPNVLKNHGAA
jgi:hypothetical protein